MSFLYHIVPQKMSGSVLYPLSELRTLFPEIYRHEVKKYDDHPKRRSLPQRRIKKLDCLQEEVIHFSPIHPRLMYQGLRSVFPEWGRSSPFFEIPIERIQDLPAVYFDMNRTGTYVFGEGEPDDLFEVLTPETYQILTTLPDQALEFYQQWKARGENSAPAMGRIPHVMVQGRVNVEGCRIVDWKD